MGSASASRAGSSVHRHDWLARPRQLIFEVPHVGKRWVHQYTEYDRERGISYGDGCHPYYDPISSLPAAGRTWWDAQAKEDTHVQV